MKLYLIIATLIIFTLTSCVENISNINKPHSSKEISIDIDKELKLLDSTDLRGNKLKIFEEPIYIGDNDEVSFRGNEMKKRSPLKIKVGDRKEIKFNGYRYTIKTIELNSGDFISIKDRDGNVFVDVEIIKE